MNKAPKPALPRRPRSHELEEESVRAFRKRTPVEKASVRERSTPEYGVDLDVELFEDGVTTGHEFLVQLKATERVKGTPRVPIKISTLNYWRSLSRPVLLVLWEYSRDLMWFKWAHEIDTYKVKPNQKTLNVKFDSDRVLTLKTWADLETEVQGFRATKQIRSSLPLSFSSILSGTVGAALASRLSIAVRRRARQYPRLLSENAPGVPEVSIRASESTVEIALTGQPSTFLHYSDHQPTRFDPGPSVENYAADIMIGISAQLYRVGLEHEAACMVRDQWRDSLVLSSDTIEYCIHALWDFGFQGEALELAELASHGSHPIGQYALPALSIRNQDPKLGVRIEDHLAKKAAALVQEGNAHEAAVTLVNAARAVRDTNSARGIELFNQAAELDPFYKERDYWWRELGSMHYFAENFRESATCYERAVSLGDRSAIELQFDSLLLSGDYAASIDLFLNHRNDFVHAEFRVKGICMPFLLEILRTPSQNRRPEEAEGAWDYEFPTSKMAITALRKDALFMPAIIWLASDSTPETSTHLKVLSALLEPTLPFLWDEALATFPFRKKELYADCLLVARQYCRDSLVEYVSEQGNDALAHFYDEAFSTLPAERARGNLAYLVDDSSAKYQRLQSDVP